MKEENFLETIEQKKLKLKLYIYIYIFIYIDYIIYI